MPWPTRQMEESLENRALAGDIGWCPARVELGRRPTSGLGVVRAAAGLGVAAKGKEGAGSLAQRGEWSIPHLGGVCMW